MIPCGTTNTYEKSPWTREVRYFMDECSMCGDNLYWAYDDTKLIISGYGDMYDYDIDSSPWEDKRNKIQNILLPEGMNSIGASAFAGCR